MLLCALAVDIMVGRGLSNKAHRERLLLGTQGDAVAAAPLIVGGVYNSRKTETFTEYIKVSGRTRSEAFSRRLVPSFTVKVSA